MSFGLVQPVVLTGGRSRRFGRDKLLEPYAMRGRDAPLVQWSIEALRDALGERVFVVGACDRRVSAFADGEIEDRFPGVGPLGGIVSALEWAGRDVFVLPGDMPELLPSDLQRIAACAARTGEALRVIAKGDLPEPCVGVYRSGALQRLRTRLDEGLFSLHDAIADEAQVLVSVEVARLKNINRPEDVCCGRIGRLSSQKERRNGQKFSS